MATIDHERKRISAILLFFGPPGSGKTTSLYALSRILPPGTHGKVAPLIQGDGRLLRLDYRPHDQELVYEYQVNFRLVTCAGPVDVNLLRPLLSAVDAIMFVADSSPGALRADVKALELLDRMVRGAQRSLDELPMVFMYNKRDLRDAVEIRALESSLNKGGANYIAASAVRGQGVLEALQRLTATVAVDLRRQMQAAGSSDSAQASNAKTVAHGTTFEAAKRLGGGNDDVTSVAAAAQSSPRRSSAWDVSLDEDDRTEINQGDGVGHSYWGDAPQDQAAFSNEQRRGAPQPSAAAFQRDYADPEPLPEPSSAFRSVESVHSTASWRTPDVFDDGVDADDRTMPASEVAELVRGHDQIAEAPPQAVAAGGGRRRSEAPNWDDGPQDQTAFSNDRRRGAPQPSAAAFQRDYADPEPLPEPSSAFRSVEPVHSTESWRTPDVFDDGVDADDRTMPASEVAELVRGHDQIAEAPPQAVAAGGGRRRSEAPIRAQSRAPAQRRAPALPASRAPAPGARRRPIDSGRTSGRYGAAPVTNPGRAAPVGRARRIETQRTAAPAPVVVPTLTPRPPPPADTPAFSANQTQVINAMGRSPETWESTVLDTGHLMRVPVPDLAGYVVSRIGTPTASSRRTVRLPVRATHLDTLVPQDFVLEITFRGGGGPGSGPAVSARKRPVGSAARTVPLSWIVTGIGILVTVMLAAFFIVQMLGT
jgi:mutual gliding-motility protein MglA